MKPLSSKSIVKKGRKRKKYERGERRWGWEWERKEREKNVCENNIGEEKEKEGND
jgi:hypothetical protein